MSDLAFNPEIEIEEIPYGKKTIKMVRGDPYGFWTLQGVKDLPTDMYTSKPEARKALQLWLDSQT
jgi:hypothetical protein